MKISKLISGVAAAVVAASMLAVSASATNWSAASYADNDPATVSIISSDENSVTFTATADGAQAKCRITVGDLLSDEDAAKVKSATWNVSYDVSKSKDGAWLGGGTYFGCKNSTGYDLSSYLTDGGYTDTTLTTTDSAKFLLPSEVLKSDSELVFIDWSSSNLVSNGVTITISDLKFFDADGNELAQKPYAGAAAADDTAAADTAAADTAVTDAAPAADATTTTAATGNVASAAIISVMAAAALAAVAAKKRK